MMQESGTRRSGDSIVRLQMRLALCAVVLTVLGGAIGVLHYIPELSPRLNAAGLSLAKLRPLHTTFASVWIFGAAVAVVYHFLSQRDDGLKRADIRRFWFHTTCWLLAGVGILVTIMAGVFSGREYIGFHPAFSVLLLVGWAAFAVSFLKRSLPGFFHQPVYLWFWTVGTLYFMYTFIEAHAYLLPFVGERPVRDLALQWKSCGTLVGSFNFMVYGSLLYVSEKVTGDKKYAQSPIAFWLFGVGCLNSFTNYVHHTYHLPQRHSVKWIAFVVSMTEIIILLRLMIDIRRSLAQKNGGGGFTAVKGYLTSAKWWTACMLVTAIVISVPNLNSLIHGTKVVVGHSMGTELGIDTMVLLAAFAYLIAQLTGNRAAEKLDHPRMRRNLIFLNLSVAALVTWLTVSGAVHGFNRYMGHALPTWVTYERFLFPLTAFCVGLALLGLVWQWMPLLKLRPAERAPTDATRPAQPVEEEVGVGKA